jgi:DNA invertase Pin-like site-specific DNA recombinase
MQYGYARISTIDQNPALQLDALEKAGCEKIYKDAGISGPTATRPGLKRCLESLEGGDRITVWKLDRVARSLRDLVSMIEASASGESSSDPLPKRSIPPPLAESWCSTFFQQ